MEGTKVLYLRVPVSLHASLVEAAEQRRADRPWERPNVQATTIALLTSALASTPAPKRKPTTKKKGGRR